MIELRPYGALGHADHGWLDARHHFSFASYHDPDRMHWGALRVWNDDRIAPGTGFPPHPHRDMEIITYVRTGAISHRDSLGNKGRTAAGDVQVMSAGTGITHSEANAEDVETTLFQIWIMPDRRGHAPSWGTQAFPKADRAGQWVVLASGLAGDADALRINADARVLAATLHAGETLDISLSAGRAAYLVLAAGSATVNGVAVARGDGLAIRDEAALSITAVDDAELVLVDSADS